ncbi:MAG: glycosyltransferase family 39 protein [Planctomycetota bacterium]
MSVSCPAIAEPEPVAAEPVPSRRVAYRRVTVRHPAAQYAAADVTSGLRLRAWWAFAAVVAVLFLFTNLGGWRVFNAHEAFAVVPAGEMLDSGDYLVPTYGGVPRLKKPPLIYWTLAVAGGLAGGLDAWTARLPSALAALALAWLVGRRAAAWYGTPAGVAAFLAQVTAPWVVTYGRTAEVDLLLCLLSTSALLLASRDREAGPLPWAWIGLLLGVSALGKFAFSPALALATIVAFFVVERRGAELAAVVRSRTGRCGLACLTAGLLAWPVTVWWQRPEVAAVWYEELVGRAVGTLGTQPWWYYLPPLLWLTLPWSPLAVPAAVRSWGQAFGRGREPGRVGSRERFLWVWLLTQVVLLSLSANKHKHYLLPVLPVISLWAGKRVAEFADRVAAGRPVHGWAAAVVGSVGVASAFAGGFVAFGARLDPVAFGPLAAAAAVTASLAVAAFVLLPLKKPQTAAAIALLIFTVPYAYAMTAVVPAADSRRDLAAFAAEVDRLVPAGEPIAAAGIGEHEIVPLLTHRVRRDLASAPDAYLLTNEPPADRPFLLRDAVAGLVLVGPETATDAPRAVAIEQVPAADAGS